MRVWPIFTIPLIVSLLAGCDGNDRSQIQAIPSSDPIAAEVLRRRIADSQLPAIVSENPAVYWLPTKRYNCFFVDPDPEANIIHEDHPGEPLYCFDKNTDQFLVEI